MYLFDSLLLKPITILDPSFFIELLLSPYPYRPPGETYSRKPPSYGRRVWISFSSFGPFHPPSLRVSLRPYWNLVVSLVSETHTASCPSPRHYYVLLVETLFEDLVEGCSDMRGKGWNATKSLCSQRSRWSPMSRPRFQTVHSFSSPFPSPPLLTFVLPSSLLLFSLRCLGISSRGKVQFRVRERLGWGGGLFEGTVTFHVRI